jgi:phosphoribosylformimino-5-aminoimidazole carboxamide ribotide isomerase
MAMQVIPAIDIINGRCVRLKQGNFDITTVYAEDPLEQALIFQDMGAKRLHLVDLDGARSGNVVNWQILETIVQNTNLMVDFGGGVKTLDDTRKILDSGAAYVTLGSIAARQPQLVLDWMGVLGTDVFFIGLDVKNEQIAISGWSEYLPISIYELLDTYYTSGFTHFFCTDISKDGMMAGPSYALYQNIIQKYPGIELVASGGVAGIVDLQFLQKIGCSGAIVGKAFYEKAFDTNPFTLF